MNSEPRATRAGSPRMPGINGESNRDGVIGLDLLDYATEVLFDFDKMKLTLR